MIRRETVRGWAPAKINRELRVGPRRADGYHPILSRFAAIDLADRLEAEPAAEISLACDDSRLPLDDSNLVLRAARALAAKARVAPGARLSLTKRVPIGAGLGGGSADAALALRLLARLWEVAASEEELGGLASSVGSDVPFFLVGGEADVSGRGDRVVAHADHPTSFLALFVPPFPIATAEVYAAFDRLGAPADLPESLEIERSGRFLGPNDLEPAVLAVRPEMARYLDAARAASRECGITGSGAAIVLAGADPDALARLAAEHPEASLHRCRTLMRREHLERQGVPQG